MHMQSKHRKRLGRAMAMIAAGALICATAQRALAHGSNHGGDHKSTPFINNFSTVTQGACQRRGQF